MTNTIVKKQLSQKRIKLYSLSRDFIAPIFVICCRKVISLLKHGEYIENTWRMQKRIDKNAQIM